MKENKVILESLKNLDKEDDYNLAVNIWQEMGDKGLIDTWNYKELNTLLMLYIYGLDKDNDLHDFIKRIGANVLETE